MHKALGFAVVLALLVPAAAVADGLPAIGAEGGDGVVSPNGSYRWVTFPSDRTTVVARVQVQGGQVDRYRTMPGRFAIPVVAYDGSASGVSADETRIVLIHPRDRLLQKRTRLVVLDERLQARRRIVLPGDFSFDALSPDGSTAYLIEYLSLSQNNFDPSNYRVRALDLRNGNLLPAPIADPTEPGEKMGGLPITRATSADGRWAYTLYTGSEHPFVHALDTIGRTARCIDLGTLTGRDYLFQLKLRLADGGRTLQILRKDKPQLVVDTKTFAVREPRPAARPAAKPAPAHHGSPLWPWAAAAAALLLLLGAATAKPLARAVRTR